MAYKLWTAEEETLLKRLVSEGKHSYRQMEPFFPGRSLTSLTCHARLCLDIHNNVYRQHKYIYDQNYFKELTIANSYIAGFLAADGCIQLTPGNPTLRLEISNLDTEHLGMIKQALGYTGVISPGGDIKRTVYFKMTVSNDYIKHLADNFGVIPNKTHHLTPPNLATQEFRLSFLIGLIDGDGCVHIGSNAANTLSISYVSSSLAAVKWFKKVSDEFNLPTLKPGRVPNVKTLTHIKAHQFVLAGARAVALVKLVQAFQRAHHIPFLTRKWYNPRLNQYINDFQQRFPQFSYTPPDFSPSLQIV